VATRADLRTRARIRADQTNSTFAQDTEYNYWLDEGAKETWYDLIQAGWPINFTALEGTASANPTVLGISGTVAFIRGVYRRDGNGYYELERIQEGQRAGLISPNGGTIPSCYDVRIDPTSGPVLEMLPAPSSVQYRVEYILEHPGFASDSTVWYGPARSDELIVLSAAAKAMRKEGNDQGAAQLDRERALLLEKVTGMASWFDMRNPPKIRDVESMKRFADPFRYQVDGIDP
jgi:hypothetical protein